MQYVSMQSFIEN